MLHVAKNILEKKMTKPLRKNDKILKRIQLQKRTETRKRVQKRRDKLRAMGFRPVQIWLPDTRRKGFRAECRRQSLVIKNDIKHETEIMTWIEEATDGAHKDWKT